MILWRKSKQIMRKNKEKFLLFALISQVHANKDEDGANNEVNGNLLGEDGPSKEDRCDGIEVDIVGSHNGTQLLQYPVPRHKTKHGGHTTQE